MKFNKFIVNRYKAITSPIVIDLEKKSLIPIIGINECGKTTILNAIFAFDHTNDSYNPNIRHLTDVHNLYDNSQSSAEIQADINITKEEFQKCFKESLTEEQTTAKLRLKFPSNFKFPDSILLKRTLDSDGVLPNVFC